jgi:hypothetical protein
MNFNEIDSTGRCLRISEYDIGSAEGPTGCKGTQEILHWKHAPHHRVIGTGENVQSRVDS